jgi:hypothetical protein
VVRCDEGVLRLLIILLVYGLIVDLNLHTLVTLCSVRHYALGLGEGFQTLGLVTHDALDLHLLLAGALVAVDGFVHLANVPDLPACVGELFDGELGLREVLQAPTALDLYRESDALKPVSMLAECILDQATRMASREHGKTLRKLGLKDLALRDRDIGAARTCQSHRGRMRERSCCGLP